MYNKKYFNIDLANYSTIGNITFLSNKYTGEWFKIPTECFEVLNYSFINKIYVEDTIECFKDDDDKEYYLRILDNLDKLVLLKKNNLDTASLMRIPKVVFSLTNRCNLKCDYCCVNSKTEYEDLPLKKIKNIIDKIIQFNPSKIIISGGEPMIRNDFFEILEYMRSVYNGKIQLSTNATYIDRHNIDKLIEYLYGIDISLDGYDQKSCELVRGKGIFNKVVENIRLLKSRDFNNISVSMVFGDNNRSENKKFKSFCEREGVFSVTRMFSRIGRGETNNRYLENEKDVAYYSKDDFLERPFANSCNAGVKQIFINYDGMVYPCALLQDDQYKICHIDNLNDSLKNKILNQNLASYRNMDNIRTINYYKCRDCRFQLFCTNCLSEMNNMTKSNDIFDYNCQKKKKILQSIDWNSL